MQQEPNWKRDGQSKTEGLELAAAAVCCEAPGSLRPTEVPGGILPCRLSFQAWVPQPPDSRTGLGCPPSPRGTSLIPPPYPGAAPLIKTQEGTMLLIVDPEASQVGGRGGQCSADLFCPRLHVSGQLLSTPSMMQARWDSVKRKLYRQMRLPRPHSPSLPLQAWAQVDTAGQPSQPEHLPDARSTPVADPTPTPKLCQVLTSLGHVLVLKLRPLRQNQRYGSVPG